MTAPSALADQVDRIYLPHERRTANPTPFYPNCGTDFLDVAAMP